MFRQSSYLAKPGEVERRWYLIDASNQVVGRLAVVIARILMGKYKPEFTPHTDTGDFVVVVNSEKVRFTGKKWDQVYYEWFSGYPGGRKVRTAREMLQRNPTKILREAVRRMLPKNKLGRRMLLKLKIYTGPQHPHQAQQPIPLTIQERTWAPPLPQRSGFGVPEA
ncbi:MAG: 50S ribosomal protein L13 [Gemmatales bacterium]|nr:50S ribosomal protein L13 [Gemmatales bacterium]MCS7161494.1 50S ribosomal protein L13 [Gemmatales bacterium]MDW8176697.1 50S ribosomal protein L13 [Gemmatales bacterium]MDW8223740.1 50S ribosomal protein L13 [Gemmatales bacterium]